MGVRHRRLVPPIETIESFYIPDVFLGQGIDILRLQTRPALLHFHGVAVCMRAAVELQNPFL